ncbi:FkbM family methyltransferase [Chloroflexia bacterium SDU3-3]|nr:FkbM family methyltransferase [Chloroflexia bacterium SDU3-3]
MNSIQLLQQHIQQSPHVQEVRWDGTREGYVAAVVPTVTAAPVIAGHARLSLPNGMAVVHANYREAFIQYHEFFSPTKPALRYGVTLGAGDVVVDIGANIGMFTLMAQLSGAHVYAVEPAPTTCDLLRINTLLYAQQGQVTVIEAGVGARDGVGMFSYNKWSPSRSGFYHDLRDQQQYVMDSQDRMAQMRQRLPSGAAFERELIDGYADELSRSGALFEQSEVQLMTLRSLLRRNQIARVDLLKVDVEGMEFDILSALPDEDWLRIQQAVVEVHSPALLDPCLALLRDHGLATKVEAIEAFGDGSYQIYARRPDYSAHIAPALAQSQPMPILTVHALEQIARPFKLPVEFRILDPYESKSAQDHDSAAFLQSIRPKLELMFCDLLGPGHTRDDFMTHATSTQDLFVLASRVYQEFALRLPLAFLMTGPYTVDSLEKVLRGLVLDRM